MEEKLSTVDEMSRISTDAFRSLSARRLAPDLGVELPDVLILQYYGVD